MVTTVAEPLEAIAYIRDRGCDIVLTDLRMGNWSGLDLLERIREIDKTTEVVLMTAYGTVELAVEAIKKGAYDFITKPLQRAQLLRVVRRALDRKNLVTENLNLREELTAQQLPLGNEIIGRSEALSSVLQTATQAAQAKASVLIEGESGTGKGVIAEYIHRLSLQGRTQENGLFVKINCAAIPENLLEAELFGYEPGAFTGATKRKKGRVELADRGTLFLDEIGAASLSVQAKLLRFLQDAEFERLGGISTLSVSTRIISATNTDLKKAIQSGLFREDLYYRLNVISLTVPSLRERKEDIPLLLSHFIREAAKRNSRPAPLLHPESLKKLCAYHWPGNIRELQNLMERLVILSKREILLPEDLPVEVSGEPRETVVRIPLGTPLRVVERLMMEQALKNCNGDKREAAKQLGIHPRTIYRYLESIEAAPSGTVC